ncbi:MAG: hypothetical protein AAF429_05455 [Pseudomonadota bacterium]
MFDAVLNLIKSRIWVIAYIFMGLITLNVGIQIYTHQTTALTPWKGGGFGMYTEPHSDSRYVWIRVNGIDENGKGSSADIRLHPKAGFMVTWQNAVSRGGSRSLQRISNAAESLRFYPNDANMSALADFASRIRWPDEAIGDLQPTNGERFVPSDITVLVAEKYVDVHDGEMRRRVIAEYRPTELGGIE